MKQLLYIFCTALLLSACKKDTARIFDESPEERMGNRINELSGQLLNAPNGWKVSLTTTGKGGYGFYMNFTPDAVTMVADLNNNSATTANTSTYRIKWVMNATLIFDTYNYIAMLQDPSPGAYGGAAGSGLKSDVEWEFQRTSGDSVFLKGFKYRNDMILVKATAQEKTRFLGADFKDNIDAFNTFFATHSNNYINVNGVTNKIEFVYDYATRISKIQYIDNNNGVVQVNGKFNFEDVGMNFAPGFSTAGVTFVKAKIEDGELVLYGAGGAKYTAAQHDIPILPMPILFAYNGTYRELYIGAALPGGITSGFNTAYQASVNKFAAMNPTRQLLDVRFVLSNSTTATVITRNTNGASTFVANASFKYTYENGIITLSNPTYDGNWTSRGIQLADITNFFAIGSQFRVDYAKSSNPAVTNIGALYKVSDNAEFFYGTLRK